MSTGAESSDKRAKSFAVPFGAASDGGLVSAVAAIRGLEYYCPACATRLVLRQGKRVRHHFAHKATNNCTRESVLHHTAKVLIVQAVATWRTGGARPCFVRRCMLCLGPHYQPMPTKVVAAELEVPVDTGRVVDVALLNESGHVVAVIEVFASHAVDKAKSSEMTVPWIEVCADHVVKDAVHLYPVQDGFRLSGVCDNCKQEEQRYLRRFDETGYLTRQWQCWKCGGETCIVTWRGRFCWSPMPPPRPVPPQLAEIWEHGIRRRYWANKCEQCGQIQGDWYLYRGPNAPFAEHEWLEEQHEWAQLEREDGYVVPWERKAVDQLLGGGQPEPC